MEHGATSEDSESSDLECWVPNAAGQQQLREEEAARQAEQQQFREEAAIRQAERETLQDQATIAEYTARNRPCCPRDRPEKHTEEQQELIDFIRTDGIHSEVDEDGIQISHSFTRKNCSMSCQST